MLKKRHFKTIVHVSSQDPCYQTGGQGITTENQCRELLFLGYQVYWLSCRIKGFPEYEEIAYQDKKLKIARISCFDSDKILTPYEGEESLQYQRRQEFGKKFVQFIKKNFSPQDTVIHLHGFYYIPLMARELKEFNTCSQYHLFLTKRMESVGETDKMFSLIRRLEIESLKVNQKILALTPDFKKEMEVIYPPAKNKIYLMPNGIDKRHLEKPFYPKTDKFKILAWGRISAEKNFESFIKAIDLGPSEINYLLFGKTDDTERNRKIYHQKLLTLARNKKKLHTLFSPQGIRGEEKIKLIDSCSLVVVPSTYEPFGLVIIEAMARGKPVITPPLPGPMEIFQTKKFGLNDYGYLCQPTPDNIAQAIKMFYRNPKLLKKISHNCQRRANVFLWSKLIKKLVKIYQK